MVDLDNAVMCVFDTNSVMEVLNENYDCNITKHILNNYFQNKTKKPQEVLNRVQRSRL
tara:strand:- start:3358 stop:3531 length:174 start_codon:yes stop_codon:yes gene_type:complete